MAKRKKSDAKSNAPTKSTLDKNGHEIPDPNPVAPALNLERQPTLAERIRQEVRSQAFQAQLRADQETFEEADDFEVGDDYDPSSPYEEEFEGQFDTRPQAAPPKAEPPRETAREANPEPTPTKPKAGSE